MSAGNDDDVHSINGSLTDPAAFSAIFESYHRQIWTFVANSTGAELADDLTGEIFVAAFESRASYRSELGSVRSWLYGIARNKIRHRLRSERRRARAFRRAVGWAPPEADPTVAVDDALQLRFDTDRVRRAIAELGEPEREVLVLYVWEQLTYNEIAAAVGIPVGTVRSRLNRARSRIRHAAPSLVDPLPLTRES